MFTKFALNLLAEAVKNPDIRAFLLELFDRMGDRMSLKLGSLIPLSAAAVVKRLGDAVGVDVPESIEELTELARTEVNKALPEGIDIPFVSDAFERVTGFDLSDMIFGRPK